MGLPMPARRLSDDGYRQIERRFCRTVSGVLLNERRLTLQLSVVHSSSYIATKVPTGILYFLFPRELLTAGGSIVRLLRNTFAWFLI